MVTGQEDNVIAIEEVEDSKDNVISVTRAEIRHEASGGEEIIDLQSLVVPSESAVNGWSNPSISEINGFGMFANRKSVELKTSRDGVDSLVYLEDFTVEDDLTIRFIGAYADDGGPIPGESFRIILTPIRANNIVVANAEFKKKSYTLPANTTILNLGKEYPANENPSQQIGAITVKRNGIELVRNVGNVAADPAADGNYHEVDNGQGNSTQIEFNESLPSESVVTVDFGLVGPSDLSLIGDQQAMNGALQKFIQDVGPEVGLDPADYINPTPSEIERVLVGNQVIDHEKRLLQFEDPLGNGHLKLFESPLTQQTDLTWKQMGGGIALVPGIWKLEGGVRFNRTSGGSVLHQAYALWCTEDGDNTVTQPETIGDVGASSLVDLLNISNSLALRWLMASSSLAMSDLVVPVYARIIRVKQAFTIYLPTFIDFQTVGGDIWNTYSHITATRLDR